MGIIDKSVGDGGENQPHDVKVVQRLLNKHKNAGQVALTIDGKVGPITIRAIREFQKRVVKLRAQNGRVDPNGATSRKLNSGPTSSGIEDKQREASEKPSAAVEGRNHLERRRKFVRPAVKEIAITTRIIDRIISAFEDVRATVISGYLNDSDRFWKVNYHWEYLLWMVDHSLSLSITAQDKRALDSMRSQLMAQSPKPDSGYRTSGRVGYPVDKSSMREMDARVKIIRQCKQDFKTITQKLDLKSKSDRSPKSFDLAAAPVAHPGTSKHGTGYALDIEGNNAQIKSIAKGLGATVVFDEQSHVHVEFKNMA